jgi:hypothetical protein
VVNIKSSMMTDDFEEFYLLKYNAVSPLKANFQRTTKPISQKMELFTVNSDHEHIIRRNKTTIDQTVCILK